MDWSGGLSRTDYPLKHTNNKTFLTISLPVDFHYSLTFMMKQCHMILIASFYFVSYFLILNFTKSGYILKVFSLAL